MVDGKTFHGFLWQPKFYVAEGDFEKRKLGALHCHFYLNNNKIIARLKLRQTRPPA